MQNNMDNPAIGRLISTIVLVIGAVILAVQGIKTGSPLLMGLVLFIPIAIYFFTQPEKMLVAMWLTSVGSLLLPGVRGVLSVSRVFMILTVGWWITSGAILKRNSGRNEKSEILLIFFGIVVLLVMSVRGFSLAIMGGYEMGGAAYIKLLLVLLLYFAASRIVISEKHIKWLLYGSVLFALIPVVGLLIAWFSRGAAPFLSQLIDLKLKGIEEGASGITRLHKLYGLAMALLMVAFTIRRPEGRGKYVIPILLIGVAFLLTMLTGFRSRILAVSIISLLWVIFQSKHKFMVGLAILGFLMVGWLFIILTIEYFPSVMQRSVAFLPLANIGEAATYSAQRSVDWRLEIWQHCLAQLKEFLWIGRGLVTDVKEWAFLHYSAYQSTEFRYQMHSYHNGPLALLVDLGVPGFLLGMLFMLQVVREGWKGLQDFVDKKSLAYRYYFILNVRLTYMVFAFVFIYGDIKASIPNFIMLAVVIRCIRYMKREEAIND